MKAVILAGGFGTRLSEETQSIPKPMIDIGGKPILWHLMKYFSSNNINEFVVALGYKSEVVKQYFLQYHQLQANLKIDLGRGAIHAERKSSENWMLDLSETGHSTMTGGRLLRLKDKVHETFIFTYGDGLSNIPINKLIEFHRSHGKLATVTAVKPMQRFGILNLSAQDEVLSFSEKPDHNNELVNGGFFILEPQVFDYIDGDDSIWEREPCERLAAEGQMMAYRHTDFWQCVDTLHELRQLRQQWESGDAQWKVW